MDIQRTLFDLPYVTQEQVDEIVGPLAPFLWPVIMDPWEDLRGYHRDGDKSFAHLDKEQTAIWLTMQAGHRARAIFDGKEGVEVRILYRKPVVIVSGRLAITFKNLTKRSKRRGSPERLTMSRADTKRATAWFEQKRGANVVDLPRVVFGYELLNEVTEIRLWIGYPRAKGRGFDWAHRFYQPPAMMPVFPKLAAPPADDHEAAERGFVISHADGADEAKEGS
jgi:hypothetical protein